jgi:hypothetical protein
MAKEIILWQNFTAGKIQSSFGSDEDGEGGMFGLEDLLSFLSPLIRSQEFLSSMNFGAGNPIFCFSFRRGENDGTTLELTIHETFKEAVEVATHNKPCEVKLKKGDLVVVTYDERDIFSSRPIQELPVQSVTHIRVGRSSDPDETRAQIEQWVSDNQEARNPYDLLQQCSRSALFEVAGVFHISFEDLCAVSQ